MDNLRSLTEREAGVARAITLKAAADRLKELHDTTAEVVLTNNNKISIIEERTKWILSQPPSLFSLSLLPLHLPPSLLPPFPSLCVLAFSFRIQVEAAMMRRMSARGRKGGVWS